MGGGDYTGGRCHGIKHKRPGYWRPVELRREIEKRFNFSINKSLWQYWINHQIIPEGDVWGFTGDMRKNITSIRRDYTDAFAEEVLFNIGERIRKGEFEHHSSALQTSSF